MQKKTSLLVLFLVTILAILLSIYGIILSGNDLAVYLFVPIYVLVLLNAYAVFFLFLVEKVNGIIKWGSIIIEMLLLLGYTYLINKYLVMFVLLLFTHLYFTSRNVVCNIDYTKPLFKTIHYNLPKKNKKVLCLFLFLSFLLTLCLYNYSLL